MDFEGITDLMGWFEDRLTGHGSEVLILISSLTTLWLTNWFTDKRERRSFIQQQESEKGQFRRQALCDLQDAIAEDHQISVRAGHENKELTQASLQGKILSETANQSAIATRKSKNLAARIDDDDIRRLVDDALELHALMLVSASNKSGWDDWRNQALTIKDELDQKIREQLFKPVLDKRPWWKFRG